MADFFVTILGAGAVGLSVALSISEDFKNILVIEKHPTFGMEISSRNSEVIHAGIYYLEGSLKARLCVEGRRRLYDFLKTHNLPFKKTGKLIVAKKNEESQLISLYQRGIANGVDGLSLIEAKDIKRLEPYVKGDIALYSKETGIFDSHSYMKKLYNLGKEKKVLFAFNHEVIGLEKNSSHYRIFVKGGEVTSNIVINASGLNSDKIAKMVGIDIKKENYEISYCKGDYFYYTKKSPVNMLIYPLPREDLRGLGVHATVDLAGRLRFGPDAYFVDKIDYTVDKNKKDHFFRMASELIEDLKKDSLMPDMSGIRPKLKGVGIRDFIIKEESEKGFEGFINLIGIESPGLTASLAIGQYVRQLINEVMD